MLILSRKKGQSIIINNNIEIVVSAIEGDQIKIGIIAPPSVNVVRKEVLTAIQQSNREAVQAQVSLDDIETIKKLKR